MDPTLSPQVVGVVVTLAERVVNRSTVMVSELINGAPVQELNVVFITYWKVGPGGGHTFGKVISSKPGTVVAVSAVATSVPPRVNICALTNLEVPPLGVNR